MAGYRSNSRFLPEQQRLVLQNFLQALCEDPAGSAIVDAWKLERSVPEAVRNDFLNAIEESWDGTPEDAMAVISRVITSEHQLLRTVEETSLPDSLANISNARHLLKAREEEGQPDAATFSVQDAAEFHALVEKNPRLAKYFLPSCLRNRGKNTDLVWWTNEHELSAELSAADLRDRLALHGQAYVDCNWLIEVDVPRADASPCAVPTVLDAGIHSRFRPGEQDADRGQTVPLSGDEAGLPEWVGRPPSTANAQCKARGHLRSPNKRKDRSRRDSDG